MTSLTIENWVEQLRYQARWVAEDVFGLDKYTLRLHKRPIGHWPSLLGAYDIAIENAEGRIAVCDESGVLFGVGNRMCDFGEFADWDEIAEHCNKRGML